MSRPVRAVFLDRDGVLNQAIIRNGKPYPPRNLQELKLLPGVREALAALKQNGFRLIVVTNQPDVARGAQSKETVEEIHAYLRRELPLDDILTCWHDRDGACNCRKPQPGLLLAARDRYGIDLRQSFLVGDRWRDVEAGRQAGCRTIFLDYHYDEPRPATPPDACATCLREAADWILSQNDLSPAE